MAEGKVASEFYLGLGKVASVVDGNSNYDEILGDRLQRAAYIEAQNDRGMIPDDLALAIIQERLAARPVPVYRLPESSRAAESLEIVAYGTTSNNRRELAFLSGKLQKHGCNSSVENIADWKKENSHWIDKGAKKAVLSTLSGFLVERGEITKGLLHQFVNYTVAFFTALESLSDIRAKVFVTANDHSPLPVAFTMAARAHGLITVYVQHAEVTGVFPENDFDFSLFRNLASREIYRQIGRKQVGHSICISRTGKAILPEALLARRNQLSQARQAKVVIYPSSILELPRFNELVKALQRNSSIERVCVKLHPAFRFAESISESDVEQLDAVPEWPHVAICGNSSVAVELLANGHMVFQYFGLDNIRADYYGFVRQGLAHQLELHDCSEVFWRISEDSADFVSVLGYYLPELTTTDNILERAREKLFFDTLFRVSGCNGIRNKNALREYQLFRGLFYLTNTFFVEGGARLDGDFNDFWTISTLNSYFDAREVALNRAYERVDISACTSVLHYWLSTKKIEWTGYIPSQEELSALIGFVSQFEAGGRALRWMETKLFDILLRHGDVESLIDFMAIAREFDLQTTGINRRIAYTRFVRDYPGRAEVLNHFFDPASASMTRLERLKLSVQAFVESDGSLEYSDFRQVESEFCLALPAIRNEYERFVLGTYAELGDRARLIDVRRNESLCHDFLSLLKGKLVGREGFSFVRLSDGEGYLFQCYSPLFTPDDAANRERHWWGTQLTEEVRGEIVRSGIDTVQCADVLGIPSVYRFLRDHSDSSETLRKTVQGRGLLSVLEGVRVLDDGKKLYTDDKANLAIFNNIENIRELGAHANKVVVVSSGNPHLIKKRIGEDLDCLVVNIPTHNKTLTNRRYVQKQKPLPYVFQEVCKRLESVVEPGDLVLVGAGVAGKVFMNVAKINSAVGLDFGSAMDEILEAGIHSLH